MYGTNSLEEIVRRAVADNRIGDALARLENAVLLGGRVEPGLVALLPEDVRERSPLLRKARCDERLREGDLLAAQRELSAILPELAARTLRRPFLSALAQLATVHLRIGRLEEARPILRFLLDEWEHGEEETGGEVAGALAAGFGLLERAPEDRDAAFYEQAAIDAFDRDGDEAGGAWAAFERLARSIRLGDPQAEPQAREERLIDCAQRMRRAELGDSAIAYLRADAAFHGGDPAVAAEAMAGCEAASLPYPYGALATLLRARIAVALGEAGLRANALPPLGPGAAVDVELQFESAYLRFERAAAGGDRAAAEAILAEARAIARLGPLAGAGLSLNRMSETLRRRDGAPSSRSTTAPCSAAVPDELPSPGPVATPESAVGVADAGAPATVPSSASAAPPPFAPAAAGPWRAFLFDRFGFERSGTSVDDIHWKRAKTKELLIYLLLQPGYAARRDVVAEALFPGGDPKKTDNRFYVAAHRLKRVLADYLGMDGGLVVKDGSVRLADGLIDYADVERYLAWVRVGDQLWATDRDLAGPMYEKAAPLYGELAPGVLYADWLDRLRGTLLARQRETLRRLCLLAEEANDPEQAEAWSREWIRLEPQQEEAYQHLLAALAEQGKNGEARTWYGQLETMLAEELGIGPLPETRRLLER